MEDPVNSCNSGEWAVAAATPTPDPTTSPSPDGFAVAAALSPWLVPLLTVLLTALVTYLLVRPTKQTEALVAKRITVYDKVLPAANDLLCYFVCIGGWRDLDPDKVIALKRSMDRTMFTDGRLFSDGVRASYKNFMDSYFTVRAGVGLPAKLRADRSYLQREWGNDWKGTWDDAFVEPGPESTDRDALRGAYDDLARAMAKEIGVRR